MKKRIAYHKLWHRVFLLLSMAAMAASIVAATKGYAAWTIAGYLASAVCQYIQCFHRGMAFAYCAVRLERQGGEEYEKIMNNIMEG